MQGLALIPGREGRKGGEGKGAGVGGRSREKSHIHSWSELPLELSTWQGVGGGEDHYVGESQ